MKKLSLLGFFGLLASVLAGCPIYSGDGHGPGCYGDRCGSGGGVPGGCGSPADCGVNETCGSDGQCHSGDCTLAGCVSGFTCVIDQSTHIASCQPGTTGTGGAGGSGTGGASSSSSSGTGGTGNGGAGTGGMGGATSSSSSSSSSSGTPTPVYCGKPSDCAAGQICAADGTCKPGPCSATNSCIFGYTCAADGTCQSPTANACDSDASCSSGDLCIAGSDGKGGVCTAPANQCFDQSQCGASEKCVAGKCTLGCSTDTDCRDGFKCDTTKGICSTPVKSCTITNDCGDANEVCVAGACVPRSTNGTCPNPGDVWTENGCIPNQAATFTCVMDGVQDACATGSICLHHSCWISCDAPNQNACTNLVSINQCKPVEDGMATYNVCGSATNLGSECGAGAMNQTCSGAGQVCVDGFCK